MTDTTDDAAAKLMKALLGKLYTILMHGDTTAPASTDSYVAWLAPGIPFEPEDFAFATKGLAGKDGAEAKQLLAQAADFSRLVNLVPDASGVIGSDHQRAAFDNSGKMLWTAYFTVLRSSSVAGGTLTAEEAAKVTKFRKLLATTKKVKNLVDDTVMEVAEDGPVQRAYNDKMALALEATTLYNNKRIAAMNADSAAIVQDWALNADSYRAAVRKANADWVTQGYKNDVEGMHAFIDQVGRRSLTLMKDDLIDQFRRGLLSDPIAGDFRITTPVPGGFATSKGWTQFSFAASNVATYERSETNAWSANVGVNYGLFTGKVGSNGSISQNTTSMDVSNFKCSFELAQVMISRPWFSPEFLTLKAWKFAPGTDDGVLSDGKRPPTGTLVGYPTTCVFVRNLKMNFNELHNKSSVYAEAIRNNVEMSYGPFVAVSAKYDRSVGESTSSAKLGEEGLEVPGMQLIAMKCQLLPLAPNPDPSITKWEA